MRVAAGWCLALSLAWCAGCGVERIQKPANFPQERVIRSYRLVAAGDKLLEEGKDHLALLKYVEAADVNPYNEVIFNKLSITYSRLSRWDEAERAVKRAIGLAPRYAYAYNTWGIIELARHNGKAATRRIKKALDIEPRVASFYANLGHSYMQSGKYREGSKAYQKALELDPNVFNRPDAIQVQYPSNDISTPERNYQMAKFFAEYGDKDSCLQYLGKALADGFSDQKRLSEEKAFDKLRADKDFQNLVLMYGLKPGEL